MSARKVIQGLLFASLLLGWASLATAQDPPDPVLRFDSSTDITLDLGLMVDDLLPLLMDAIEQSGDDDRQAMTMLIDLLGVRALDRLEMRARSTKDRSSSKLVLTLDQDRDGGLLAEMMAIPDRKCGFAGFVDRDQVMMFSTVQNFRDHLGMILGLLARPELAEMTADLPRNADGELEIAGFNPRRDLLPLLSGELDVFILDLPAGGVLNPMAMPAFLVLGTEDGPAVRDLIVNLAGSLAGGDEGGLGEMLSSLPVEAVGDFELTVTPFGAAYAVSRDYLVIGMTAEPLRTMLARPAGNLDVPAGRTWAYVDGAEYSQAMAAIMEMAGQMGDQDAMEAAWANRMSAGVLEYIESEVIHTTSKPGQLTVEVEVDGSMMTGLYAMLSEFMEELPAMIEQQRIEDEREDSLSALRDAVGMLDAAFMDYAADHEGLYPSDPQQLVTGGYLEEIPLVGPTPPGVYLEGGYTYHPLLNDEEQVVGYFMFVYGGGQGTGYDLYSAENVEDVDDYFLDADGIPDGIATYCYDGVALELMAEW